MGDRATLAKARKELEELYLGVPDDSVNLTFQDLAEVKEKKRSGPLEPISEVNPKIQAPLAKLPSLDFSRGLQESIHHGHDHQQHNHYHVTRDTTDSSRAQPQHHRRDDGGLHASRGNHHNSSHAYSPRRDAAAGGFRHAVGSGMADDDVSVMSGTSMASMTPYQERGRRRRPGIPHSNICTICSVYIYIFRHRCLVCGRVYCRQCVSIGMGEMTEGRKCIECLGRRFSQRYIQRAGEVGCCMSNPGKVKQEELKWAEKGPRRSRERGYARSTVMSRAKSPVNPRTTTRAHASSSPSFVMNSPYSAYSPTNHPLPI